MIPVELDHIEAVPFGSHYTVFPPVLNTDIDWMVLVADIAIAHDQLDAIGFTPALDGEYPDNRFMSMRKGMLNITLVEGEDFFYRQYAAALLCARYNVKSKENRIAIYEALRHDDLLLDRSMFHDT